MAVASWRLSLASPLALSPLSERQNCSLIHPRIGISAFVPRTPHGISVTGTKRRCTISTCNPRGSIRVVQESLAEGAERKGAGSSAQLGSLLAGVEVLSWQGESVAVTGLWTGRKAVVAFARHFGCLLCKKRAAQLIAKKEELEKGGVALVIIGPGSPQQASAFREQTSFPGEVYADPTQATFLKLGFVSGASSIFNPKALVSLVGARLEGHQQDWSLSLQKDTVLTGGWQQGGVLVAGPQPDDLLFLFKDEQAGDEPDWTEVVKAALQN